MLYEVITGRGVLRQERFPLRRRPTKEATALATRFALALDSRIDAAFAIAEIKYRSALQVSAGVTSVILAVLFQYLTESYNFV